MQVKIIERQKRYLHSSGEFIVRIFKKIRDAVAIALAADLKKKKSIQNKQHRSTI